MNRTNSSPCFIKVNFYFKIDCKTVRIFAYSSTHEVISNGSAKLFFSANNFEMMRCNYP